MLFLALAGSNLSESESLADLNLSESCCLTDLSSISKTRFLHFRSVFSVNNDSTFCSNVAHRSKTDSNFALNSYFPDIICRNSVVAGARLVEGSFGRLRSPLSVVDFSEKSIIDAVSEKIDIWNSKEIPSDETSTNSISSKVSMFCFKL